MGKRSQDLGEFIKSIDEQAAISRKLSVKTDASTILVHQCGEAKASNQASLSILAEMADVACLDENHVAVHLSREIGSSLRKHIQMLQDIEKNISDEKTTTDPDVNIAK